MQRQLVGLLAACGCVVTLAQEPAVPVRVGTQGIAQPRPIDVVKPWARVESGTVSMDVTISPQGRVSDVRVIRLNPGDPLTEFEQGMVDAVRQWRFESTVMKGAAVPVVATVTVNNRAWPPSPPIVIRTPTPVKASLTVNVNRYGPVVSSGSGPDAAMNARVDSTMPSDFAVRYMSMCGAPIGTGPTGVLTIDTAADEAYVAGQRVWLGAQTANLERLYLAMRVGGTFVRWSEHPGGEWQEPTQSGITTAVRPDGVEVTVNQVPSPINLKNTVPWMVEFGWNLEFRLNGIWRRSARGGYRSLGTQSVEPPSELPLLLDMLERSDDVKRLSIPLPRGCN